MNISIVPECVKIITRKWHIRGTCRNYSTSSSLVYVVIVLGSCIYLLSWRTVLKVANLVHEIPDLGKNGLHIFAPEQQNGWSGTGHGIYWIGNRCSGVFSMSWLSNKCLKELSWNAKLIRSICLPDECDRLIRFRYIVYHQYALISLHDLPLLLA